MTFALLYHRKTAALAFDAYLAANRGDSSALALISLASDFMLPRLFLWGDVLCKGSIDYDPSRDYVADLDPPDSIVGSPMSLLIWGPLVSGHWPVAPIPEALRHVQPSSVETLILSGSVDFSTPAEAATNELLPSLRHGKQVIWAELGHCSDLMSLESQAFGHLVTGFFNTGVADETDFVPKPMDFSVRWGLPLLAKVIVGSAGLVTLLVGLLAWRIVRRIRA